LRSASSTTKIERAYRYIQLKLLAERRLLRIFSQLGVPALLSRELTALWRCGGPPAGTARLGSDPSTKGSCHRVNRIKLIHQRLAEADGLPAVLSVSWEIFELVGTIASASAGESPDMYPAFTFARGSADCGRNAIAFAPSTSVRFGQTPDSHR